MTALATSLEEPMATHHFVLVRDQALCSALRDVESVPGVRVLRIEFETAGKDQPALSAPS